METYVQSFWKDQISFHSCSLLALFCS